MFDQSQDNENLDRFMESLIDEKGFVPPFLEISIADDCCLIRQFKDGKVNVLLDHRSEYLSASPESVLIIVDGGGFDPLRSEPTGWPRFGLRTMRERAQAVGGSFELSSHPAQGTRVVVQVPLVQPKEAVHARAAG